MFKRELARWKQEWSRRWKSTHIEEHDDEASALPWLDRVRWWLLPLLLGAITLGAWFQLSALTQADRASYRPIVLDAPLSSPMAIRWSSSRQGRYFLLRSKGVEGRFIALQPESGTRAYKGSDAVPLFDTRLPAAEFIPSQCQARPRNNDVLFYTGDGMALWLCQNRTDEERFELRRIGWRLPTSSWQSGLTLGRSSENAIVLGSALIPARSLHLKMIGQRLRIRSMEHNAGLSSAQRLVCWSPLSTDASRTPSSTAPPCTWKTQFIEPGGSFRLFARNHPKHAVTLRWQPSQQEKGMYDLSLFPMDGNGLSVRHIHLRSLQKKKQKGFLVSNAEVYFRSVQPDTVRTHDLDNLVHELILRRVLEYIAPSTLRTTLASRYNTEIHLEHLAQRLPLQMWHPQLKELYSNRYMRNRIWMANRALAHNYRLRARTLFRIRFPKGQKQGALEGLGPGGGTLRAPTRDLLHRTSQQKQRHTDPRLSTTLTTRNAGTPFLQPVGPDGVEQSFPLIFLQRKHTELVVGTHIPHSLYRRSFRKSAAIETPRTAFWVGSKMYVSYQPFAYTHSTQPKRPMSSNGRPAHFVYTPKKRWWKRTSQLQRSSVDWPIADIAARLGTLLTQEKLSQAIERRNPRRWKERKHCGNQSLKQNGRWKHKASCWGRTKLVRRDAALIIPCSDALRSKVREQYCKPGQKAPQIDRQGRPLLDTVKQLQGLHGVVLTASTSTKRQYNLHVLPNSRPVYLNEQALQTGTSYSLRHADKLRIGTQTLQYQNPSSTVAHARFRGEHIAPFYPQGPTFAHVISGSVGGPFRSDPKKLVQQLPPASSSGPRDLQEKTTPKPSTTRKIATTLDMDLQRIVFSTARKHFARMDSPAFQKRFRRRFFKNPHKPHSGSVVIVNRRNGHILTALSFPSFDPNLPALQSQLSTDQRTYKYLRGQIMDRFGITDGLLAYNPSRLPPSPPKKKRLEGQPNPIPHFLEALGWDKEEELRGIRGSARSGWLLERALGGAQTPGSTAKIVTAIAYANFLRKQGRAVRFPKHTCGGGMMFMREKQTSNASQKQWKPSTIRFRCHKKSGHGQVGLSQALASSCNVYFAKLALEMAGASSASLRKGSVRWIRNRHGGKGRYQFIRIPRMTLSNGMKHKVLHRTLFKTAASLGFSMRYTYARKKRTYARYTDIYWESGMTPFKKAQVNASNEKKLEQTQTYIRQRMQTQLPDGFVGQGRYFGRGAAYPAWQQWVHGAHDPRHQRPISVTRVFGSTDASLRGMAYVGFGQNLITTPLRMALIAGSVANGGWLPLPQLWLGDWTQAQQPPSKEAPSVKRRAPRRVFHAADSKQIIQAMAAVTQKGTAAQPFSHFNRQCLHTYGLQVIGKTGTAETRSQKSRSLLLKRVRAAGPQYALPSKRSWFKQSGCHKRRFWKHYYPEENIADSLFVGTLAPSTRHATEQLSSGKGWKLGDLAFAVVVNNGYHPEGVVCRQKGRDLDRTEAKYLAHDILLSITHHLGGCKDYIDRSQSGVRLSAPRKRKRTKRRRSRKRKRRRRLKRKKRRKRRRVKRKRR